MTSLATRMMGIAKRLVRRAVHDYRINWIYASAPYPELPLPSGVAFGRLDESGRRQIAGMADEQFRKTIDYHRLGATGYALSKDGVPVSAAHVVDVAHYEHTTTWPLHAGEAALVDIATRETARGRGYAAMLISHATASLSSSFSRIIAFIWWNHHASRRAFHKAGWRRIGFSIEIVARDGGVRHLHLPIPMPPHRPRRR